MGDQSEEIKRRNEFLIHLKATDIEKLDGLFLHLLTDETFGADLIGRRIFLEENNVAYRIKISATGLILFKKKFDELIAYESLELFEFKEW